jgi:hypothetical protein
MITITDFSQLMNDMTTHLDGLHPQLEGHVLIASDRHLVKRLGDKKGIWIAVTIPSADPAGNGDDNVAETNIVWMFILEKTDPGSMSAADELAHYQKLQNLTKSVKNWLRDQKLEGNEFLEHLNLQSIHTDPEYQVGGWNGWGLSFNFETDGY